MSCADEEQMTFETLMLVCKNYIKHGFKNIILSDLNDKRLFDITEYFKDTSYVIFTLYSNNDDVIKQRILNRNDGNEYKNFKESFKINNMIKGRNTLPNEYRIRPDNQSADNVTSQIVSLLAEHRNDPFNANYNRNEYFSYTN